MRLEVGPKSPRTLWGIKAEWWRAIFFQWTRWRALISIEGDFTEQTVFDHIQQVIGESVPSAVLSDMAPNMSGIVSVDQPKAMYLVELALDLAVQILPQGGVFVAKVFHGEGFDEWLKSVRERFLTVHSRKPAASRPRSKEVYVVAKGFRG